MSNQKQVPQGAREIKITDNIPGGEYTNLMHTSHNKDEFHLIFSNVLGANGKVVSKLITSPGHYKRIVTALQDNLKKYEDKFGEIKEAAELGEEIGFKG